MNLNKAVYKSARIGFGLSHLVFQTLADLSLETEVSIVRKTGIYNGNTKTEVTQEVENNYRLERLKQTAKIQQASADRLIAFKLKLKENKLKLKIA